MLTVKPFNEKINAFIEYFILYALFALIILVPLPFGSVQHWASSTLTIVMLSMGILWCIGLLLGNRPLRVTPFGWGWIIIIMIALFQMVPLPAKLLELISPKTFDLCKQVGLDFSAARPISFYPYATFSHICKIVGFTVFYLMVVNRKDKNFSQKISYAIIIIGFFEAIYGLCEMWSGRNQIFGYKNLYSKGFVFGTFINRNHFAAFLEMAFPITLGLFLSKMQRIARKHQSLKQFIIDAFSDKNPLYFLNLFILAIIALALIFSGSRGGIIALSISLVFFLSATLYFYRGLFRKVNLIILFFLAMFCFFWLSKGNVGFVMKRFESLRYEAQGRISIWSDSLTMASDFKAFGGGIGTYVYLFPKYHLYYVPSVYYLQSVYPDGVANVEHAHNEYLELICESGLLGFFALLIGGVLTFLRAFHQMDLLRLGILTGIISISLHNLVDFNLRIPANALMYVLLFSLLQVQTDQKQSLRKYGDNEAG